MHSFNKNLKNVSKQCEQICHKENTRMANKNMKIFSISIVVEEVKIQPKWATTMPSLEWLELIRLTIPSVVGWQGCKASRTFTYCWWEYNMVQPRWKTARQKREHSVWFRLYATGENTNVIYSDRKQVSGCHGPRFRKYFVKKQKGTCWITEMYNLIVVMITWVYKIFKIHENVYLR